MNRVGNAIRMQSAALALAVRCAILPLTCLWSRRDRHLLWHLIEAAFGGGRIGGYPVVPLGHLCRPDTRVQLTSIPGESYNVTEEELLALAVLAARSDPSHVFEIGTANGRSTRVLALNAGRALIWTLNLPLPDDPGHTQEVPIGALFLGTPEGERVRQLWGDSQTLDFTTHAGRCQLVYVDADHSELGVTRDTKSAMTLVDRTSGVIVWHDALRYGVQTALPKLARSIGPISRIAGTNLAILCFRDGVSVTPQDWCPEAARCTIETV